MMSDLRAYWAAQYNPAAMLNEETARTLLEPFGLELTSEQMGQILTYLELLLHWNRKINLTAIRSPEECITRHFGESLYLARWVELKGSLLDIGSGAGFPGLALKIAAPRLSVTLLEPTGKKRAFVREAARACEMERVEVRPEHLEKFLQQRPARFFNTATARAVGQLDRLLPQASRCLICGGHLCLWVSMDHASRLLKNHRTIEWHPAIDLPLTHHRQILVGTRASAFSETD